ncbi:hypothetical protein HG531_006494 [Fusarium graminearum]|nr:hypothetical protein HG531_006494 [Fusarium graminearum]
MSPEVVLLLVQTSHHAIAFAFAAQLEHAESLADTALLAGKFVLDGLVIVIAIVAAAKLLVKTSTTAEDSSGFGLIMFLGEELIGTSREHRKTPLDHDGMVDKRHLDRTVLRGQFHLRRFLVLLFLSIFIGLLTFWQQLSVTSDAILRPVPFAQTVFVLEILGPGAREFGWSGPIRIDQREVAEPNLLQCGFVIRLADLQVGEFHESEMIDEARRFACIIAAIYSNKKVKEFVNGANEFTYSSV